MKIFDGIDEEEGVANGLTCSLLLKIGSREYGVNAVAINDFQFESLIANFPLTILRRSYYYKGALLSEKKIHVDMDQGHIVQFELPDDDREKIK